MSLGTNYTFLLMTWILEHLSYPCLFLGWFRGDGGVEDVSEWTRDEGAREGTNTHPH